MSFVLDPTKPIDDEIGRVCRKQLEKIRAGISSGAVHDARKAVKRLRAVLRLTRPEPSRRDDRLLRDLGRSMAAARDAEVLAALLSELRPGLPLPDAVDDPLAVLRADTTGSHLDPAASGKLADDVERRVRRWHVKGSTDPGLQAVYKQARLAMREAAREPSGEALHEWRKQVKYHWHQCELVGATARAETLHVVADRLGDDHDLHVLGERFPDVPGLAELVAERRRALREEAFDLGSSLFSVRPRDVRHHLLPAAAA